MGRRGPRPEILAIAELKGSPRAKRLRKAMPEPMPGVPACPRWLEPDAKKAFRWLVKQLDFMRVLNRSDTQAMVRYATLWARWKRAELHLQRYGDTYPLKDELGRVRCFMPWPQVAIASKLAHELTRLEQEFGLTPSSRTRIEPLPQQRPATIHDALLKYFQREGPHPDEIFGKGCLERQRKERERMQRLADQEQESERKYHMHKAIVRGRRSERQQSRVTSARTKPRTPPSEAEPPPPLPTDSDSGA